MGGFINVLNFLKKKLTKFDVRYLFIDWPYKLGGWSNFSKN